MNDATQKRISKFLSLVLRHRPEAIGITLNESGWVGVEDLLAGLASVHRKISWDQLQAVVHGNDKQRFEFNADQTCIRARQGHSVQVNLGYESSVPPEILYHGTPEQYVASVMREGLKKQKRHHVHLHGDAALAAKVGQRRGRPVLLTIAARRMADAGHTFYLTPNQVWLTNAVPVQFIRRAQGLAGPVSFSTNPWGE